MARVGPALTEDNWPDEQESAFGFKITLRLFGSVSLTASLPLGLVAYYLFANMTAVSAVVTAAVLGSLAFGLLGSTIWAFAAAVKHWLNHDVERFRRLHGLAQATLMDDVDNAGKPPAGGPHALLHRRKHLEVELEDLRVCFSLERRAWNGAAAPPQRAALAPSLHERGKTARS